MKQTRLHLLLLLAFSLNLSGQSNDGDAIIGIMREILSTPKQQPAPPEVKKIRQYPFNPEYPDIYLGDAKSENVSVFVEVVFYGRTQDSEKYLVLISGKSSDGNLQKKISFSSREDFLHFQALLENKDYERLYLFSEGSNEADYMLIKKPLREAPDL
ncbi:MAG TPA: hypothetical protein VJ952_04465 [Opitutales bacterium]|nr:hypothetical protein [Opitutales bacterium]